MFPIRIALRFLFSRKREKFISVNAFLSIGSVMLSVLVLIVVIGVMTGFGVSLREKIMTMTPHLLIYGDTPLMNDQYVKELIRKDPEVETVSPYIMGNAVMEHNQKLFGVNLRGISENEPDASIRLNNYVKMGESIINEKELIVGKEMAKTLNLSLGEKVILHAPGGSMSHDFPGYMSLKVVGIYESGLYEFDAKFIFLNLKDAQILFGFEDQIHGYSVAVKNPEMVSFVKKRSQLILPEFFIFRTWIESNKAFFAALKTEKNMMFILMTLAILIASLNIVSTLVMMVMEKFKDIGILKAIGCARGTILKIFLFKGFLIGVVGTLGGALGGAFFLKYIDAIEQLVAKYTGYEAFPPDVYYFDHIPVNLRTEDLLFIIFLGISVSVLAALYPAVKASKLHAIEALRYE